MSGRELLAVVASVAFLVVLIVGGGLLLGEWAS